MENGNMKYGSVFDKTFIEGRPVNVVDYSTYITNPDPELYNGQAVRIENCVLPIRTTTYDPEIVGYYHNPYSAFDRIVMPTEDQMSEYSTENTAEFSDVTNLKELVLAQTKLYESEARSLLCDPANIYRPIFAEDEDPLLVGLKTALGYKKCDINKYSDRFDGQFNNDRRKLNGTDISKNKACEFAKNFDIRMTVTFEDASPDVPNPMGRPVTVVLVPGRGD